MGFSSPMAPETNGTGVDGGFTTPGKTCPFSNGPMPQVALRMLPQPHRRQPAGSRPTGPWRAARGMGLVFFIPFLTTTSRWPGRTSRADGHAAAGTSRVVQVAGQAFRGQCQRPFSGQPWHGTSFVSGWAWSGWWGDRAGCDQAKATREDRQEQGKMFKLTH